MAYVQVHSVKNTLGKSLKYIKNPDKTTFIGEKNDLRDAMKYIENADKTRNYVFVEGYQCSAEFAEFQFNETREKYLAAHGGKERNTTGKPALAWHLIQSFPPGVQDPVLIHQMGMELAEKIGGGKYQAVVSTHVEGSHCMHNHILFSAYPMDPNGKKYHRTVQEYEEIKRISDEIGLHYGIQPIPNKGVEFEAPTIGETSAKRQDASWKQNIRDDIRTVSKVSQSWDQFKDIMMSNGYTLEEHKGYVKYLSPYSSKAVRDRTLGEGYKKEYLETLWDPAARRRYEEKQRREDAKNAAEYRNMSDEQKAELDKARWQQAEELAVSNKYKPNPRMGDDPAYRVPRIDSSGRRRGEAKWLILVAIRVIRSDAALFEDQAGTYRFPTSPIYAPRDWRLQKMLEASAEVDRLGITDQSDLIQRRDELNNQLTAVATDIRKKKAYLNRMEPLHSAIEDWRATKDIAKRLDALPEDQKEAFKAEHADELAAYSQSVSVFYKYSGAKATTPIMVYDKAAGKKIPSEENIRKVLENAEKTKQELNALEEKRRDISKEIGRVRKVATSVALAQNELFCHGPQYTPEKLREIRERAAAKEREARAHYESVEKMDDDGLGEYMDELLREDKPTRGPAARDRMER